MWGGDWEKRKEKKKKIKQVQLGHEVREKRGEKNEVKQFRNLKCYVSKNDVENNNWILLFFFYKYAILGTQK